MLLCLVATYVLEARLIYEQSKPVQFIASLLKLYHVKQSLGSNSLGHTHGLLTFHQSKTLC